MQNQELVQTALETIMVLVERDTSDVVFAWSELLMSLAWHH
jgi:hypothetical protein